MATDARKSTVLVCVNETKNSEEAFDFYRDKVHIPENEIVILHVTERIRIPATFRITEQIDHDDIMMDIQNLWKTNRNIEEKYCKKAQDANIKHAMLTVPCGDLGIGPIILDEIQKLNASMVVLGTRGHGLIKRTFYGSVSGYVLHHSPVPVFICPSQE